MEDLSTLDVPKIEWINEIKTEGISSKSQGIRQQSASVITYN
jgi:hypothetical protein